MAGSMVYRPIVGPIDHPKMVSFRRAMTGLQARLDNRGFNHIAGFHGAPGWYCWHHQFSSKTQLQARLFLPWHRAYLWWLEQALQDQEDGAALPWWDWTTDQQIPAAYSTRQIDGEANPLYRFRMRVPATTMTPAINRYTRRSPGSNPIVRLPSGAEIDALLQETDWASFSDNLQNFHDQIHVWVGGDMSVQTTAGYDPIFFAHHCMVDRIWYLWQVRHGNGGIPSDLLDLPLQPFGKLVRDTLDVQTLGYEYAVTTTEIDIGGA